MILKIQQWLGKTKNIRLIRAWGRAWFVKVRSDHDKILITCNKLVKLGDLLRIGCSLSGRDEPI